jgi:hypothetical protein
MCERKGSAVQDHSGSVLLLTPAPDWTDVAAQYSAPVAGSGSGARHNEAACAILTH